ncbi:GrpB family protein [Kribbella aluminosa]
MVPSNRAWQPSYDRVAPKLQAALGDLAVAVEHIGSTAVPASPSSTSR